MSRHIPPLPWRADRFIVQDAKDDAIALCEFWDAQEDECADNADFIVHAVNNHDALLTALRAARARLALVFEASGRDPRDDETVREIDAAIEKATS